MSSWGGSREGSGRRVGSGRFGEQTKPIRVPVSSVDLVFRFVDQGCLNVPFCSDGDLLLYGAARPLDRRYLGELVPSGDVILVVVGDVLSGSFFEAGDLLLVRRFVLPSDGDIVIVRVGDGYAVERASGGVSGPVWGVVSGLIRSYGADRPHPGGGPGGDGPEADEPAGESK